jgi:transketolase
MSAAHLGLDNLIAIVDDNQRYVTGPSDTVMRLSPLGAKFESFGWHVSAVDGHDLAEIRDTLDQVRRPETAAGRPRVIRAKTLKGKGVSFMENNDGWHAGHLTAEQAAQALEELDA